MTAPVLNQLPSDPDLQDVLDLLRKQISLNLNCHAIATIKTFDPGGANRAPRVSAEVNYKKTYFLPNTKGTYVPQLTDYPPLVDMPVFIVSGGDAALTMPIAAGDECVVLFNDRDLDNWFQSGQTGTLSTNRLHSFADGIALIGVNSNLNPILNYDVIRALLTNGVVKVGINPTNNKATIMNAVTTLNTALQELITGILGMTAGGNPMVDATGKVAAAATALGNLLE